MNCEEATRLMDGYLDAELDPISNQTIEEHLRDCRKCEQAYEAQRSLVRALEGAPYYKAPSELRERIQSSLRNEIDGQTARVATRSGQLLVNREEAQSRSILFGTRWNSFALAAAIILAATVISIVVPRLRQTDANQFLATQLIASHVRSLMANHLFDVASSDQHTVKPWLDAKLDFAPPVVDLSSAGFPLLGGRLDYLDNRPAAALIYQRRKHFINLFVWPAGAEADRTMKATSRQGYQLLHWVDSDFNYWAVSDVSVTDLQTLKELFEKQTHH